VKTAAFLGDSYTQLYLLWLGSERVLQANQHNGFL